MKKLFITLIALLLSNYSFSQSIDGKWIFEVVSGQSPNTMYEFKDGLRFTYYCTDVENGCDDAYWNSLETSDAIPNPHTYTLSNDTLTIDINFGNFWVQEVSFECNGDVISFGNPDQSTWWKVGTDLEACQQVDSCIAIPIDDCFALDVWDPVCGCDGVTYSNSGYASCNSIYDFTDGACTSQEGICTSNSGIEIMEVGEWENPNDPCDIGECTLDGQFLQIVIDCAEDMGMPCNGEWVDVEGECCPICVESLDSCCVNPAWIDPTAMCSFLWDPVIGCDGIEYANSCVAEAAGISSWTDQFGSETVLNWDCEPQSDSTSCEAYFEWGGGNPYLVFSNLSTYSEIEPENITLLWDFGNGYTTFSENPVYTYDSAGYYEVCLTISIYDTQNNQTCTSTYCDSISYMVPGTTWDCGPFGCYNPGTGMGQYTSIESCEASCNISSVICTSTSGIEISSVGFWENPNDPCDTGECTADGQFLEIVIDCEEEMGTPCNGEWVEIEGQCCSECVENVGLNEITNEEFRLIKMIDILGRKQNIHKSGQTLFYIYDNGKVVKRMK